MDYDIINYSGIFLSYIHKENCKCSFNVSDHTLLYVYSGYADIIEPGNITQLHAGECAFIRKDHRVTLNKFTTDDGPYQSISLCFDRSMLLDFYRHLDKGELPENAHRSHRSVIKIDKRPDVTSLFQSITPYFDADEAPDSDWIKLKLVEGLRCVLHTDKDVYASLFDFAEPWKIDLMGFMNKNYKYDLTMEELANYTGRSLSTFKRDFKKATGTTPEKWLIERRLTEAHKLLSEKSRKVQDVMMRVGFSNPTYFSRIYKDRFGYSPAMTVAAI